LTVTVPAGTYSVTEQPAEGWLLDDIDCAGGTTALAEPTATITVEAGDRVFCTFRNLPAQGSLVVTGVFAYGASVRGAGAVVGGQDRGFVTGTAEALARVEQICLTSTWKASAIRRLPTSLPFLWNGQPGPFEDGSVTLVDRTVQRRGLTWISSEIVTYESCGAGITHATGSWPGSPVLNVTHPATFTAIAHSLTVTVYLRGGRTLPVEVGEVSTSARRGLLRNIAVETFTNV
jgi:hypothetical protein